MRDLLEQDLKDQIKHNVRYGLLAKTGHREGSLYLARHDT